MKRMLLTIAFFLIFVPKSFSKDLLIGTVDMNRIFNEYIEFQETKKELDRFVLEWERQRDSLKRYIDSLKNVIEIEKPALTEKGKQKREMELQKAQEAYSQYLRTIWGDNGLFYRKSSELLQPYYKKIRETIKNVADQNGASMVLNSQNDVILYASNSIDLTDQVLQQLNKTFAQEQPKEGSKYRIAIFPIMETEAGAQKLQLGNRLQKAIYQGIQGVPNLEILGTGEVNGELSKRSLTNDKLFPENCQQVALSLNADYFICGTVSTSGDDVNFTYTLYKTATFDKISETQGSATNPRESLDVESIQKAKQLIQQFKP